MLLDQHGWHYRHPQPPTGRSADQNRPTQAGKAQLNDSPAASAAPHPGYLAARLQRNGETVTVTDPADFAQIIRRRLFTRTSIDAAARAAAGAYVDTANDVWITHVYSKLGSGRSLSRLVDRVIETYPFHPDLFELVAKEWSKVQAFQRVRSTVAIFARTALYWINEHKEGRWAPDLIGPGDIPVHTDSLEALLSSGILAGNVRAIQGFRAVANTDVVRSSGGSGTAFNLDAVLETNGVNAGQPAPAVRMATACFAYSLVPRAQGARGATKAELIAALSGPGVPYPAAEEVFNALIAGPVQGGLGALEHTRPANSKGTDRFYLSIKQTLGMYHSSAMTMTSNEIALDRIWKRAQDLASKAPFSGQHFVEATGDHSTASAAAIAAEDGPENRLLVLDPRQWTLLNGKDTSTRSDLDVAFGVKPGLAPTFAASMVAVLVNTQRRARARDRAKDVLAWERVVDQLDPSDEDRTEARIRRDAARNKLDAEIKWAYQHYAYLLRTSNGLAVQYKSIADGKTALAGRDVWDELVATGRAVAPGALASEYVSQLIASGGFGRHLTPKELFALPYSNPEWPLIADPDDLRQALFQVATSKEWMLADSDGNEVRPSSPSQIQPASMQQLLRPRPTTTPAATVPSQRNTQEHALPPQHARTPSSSTGARASHSGPVHHHAVQRPQRRRQTAAAPSQPSQVRRAAPATPPEPHLLDHPASRRLPAHLPPHRRSTGRPVRADDLYRHAQRRSPGPPLG
ncbi:DUF499 domain-containing protein [Actinoplanes sp. NPDC020271]|uniref:DUF499 domain-containing protein n=1 Tax=Actinoplanes sp. NPDC020271 TaxID=3363896 RepID=UPI0037998E5F